jgi:hypothetical protein
MKRKEHFTMYMMRVLMMTMMGSFNEDGVGGIDMNRNFPREWGMEFEQNGAGPFPLSEPETPRNH